MMMVAVLVALAVALEPLAAMLEPLTLPLPPPTPVMLAAELHPPAPPLPALAPPFHPLASALESPAMPPGMVAAEALVLLLPGVRHAERVGCVRLRRKPRRAGEQARRNDSEQPSHPDHRVLPWP